MIAEIQRMIRRPGFPALVLLLVATVVAVNTTAFGALHALRWKALPYPQADALIEARADLQSFGFKLGFTTPVLEGLQRTDGVFAGVAGFSHRGVPVRDEHGQRWQLIRIGEGMFTVLGVQPRLGRAFIATDFVDQARSIVLSDQAWRSRFDADPDIIGRGVDMQGQTFLVVGVMPPGFAFPAASVDAWIPLIPSQSDRVEDATGNVGWLSVIARLQPGMGLAQAEAALAAVLDSEDSLFGLRQVAGLHADVRPWRERFAGTHTRALALLQWAALALLAVVAGNLAILTLDRSLSRAQELSIRRAIGARPQALRGLLWRDLLLPALPGLALGLLLSGLGMAWLLHRGLMPRGLPMAYELDLASLAAGLLAAALTVSLALGVGTLAASRVADGLNARSPRRGVLRTRLALLVCQVALTTALLGGSALLLRSAHNLVTVDRGFDMDGVVVAAVDAAGISLGHAYDADQQQTRLMAQVDSLIEALSQRPGVQYLALSNMPPFSEWESISSYRIDQATVDYSARTRQVGPDYLRALGAPLLAGRTFSQAELTQQHDAPVLVDALFVQRHLQDRQPIGATVLVPADGQGNYRQASIIGVVSTMKHERLDELTELATIYHPAQGLLPVFWLVARTQSDPAELVQAIRAEVNARFPAGELLVNERLEDRVLYSLRDRQALLEAVALFAVLTLLLCSLGLYAVLSHAVHRELPALGLRMALGARSTQIAAMVMQRGLAVTASGALLGLAGGLLAAYSLLQPQLFLLKYGDPLAWSAAASLVAMVTLIACLVPARRAAQIEPMAALCCD